LNRIGGVAALVLNATVTGNRAAVEAGGVHGSANLVIRNSIVSGNTAPSAPDLRAADFPTVYGPIPSNLLLANSAIGSSSGFTPNTLSGSNLPYGADLRLGPLADNGGPTRTHALLPGSPAIDAGSNPAGLAYDQRGPNFARVHGVADIGAFEVQRPARVQTVAVDGGAAQRSRVTELTVTFSHQVTLPADPAAAFRLTRVGPGGPAGNVGLTVDLSGSTAGQTVARLNFAGPLTAFGSLIDGNYTLTVLGGLVTGPGGLLVDGDGDGTPGGDAAIALHRLYGDVNGDRRVDSADFFQFRTTFGRSAADPLYLALLDANGDGRVDNADFFLFRTRFGTTLDP
jgi:hypothetical protein